MFWKEQKPAEVTKPRGPWETKGSTSAKVRWKHHMMFKSIKVSYFIDCFLWPTQKRPTDLEVLQEKLKWCLILYLLTLWFVIHFTQIIGSLYSLLKFTLAHWDSLIPVLMNSRNGPVSKKTFHLEGSVSSQWLILYCIWLDGNGLIYNGASYHPLLIYCYHNVSHYNFPPILLTVVPLIVPEY